MHKAASTFVAAVLLPSIANRTKKYDLYSVGSMAIKFRQRELAIASETGVEPESDDQYEILKRCLRENPLPASNGLIGRLYPNHLPTVERSMGIAITDRSNRLIVIRRDPRDAVISLYYSLAVSHDLDQMECPAPSMQKLRDQLLQEDICGGIKMLVDAQLADIVFNEFVVCHDLIVSQKRVCDLPYEKLVSDPKQWLAEFARFGQLNRRLGIRKGITDRAWIKEMLPHLQPPKTENPNSHKRRMKPGNWVDVFDDDLHAIFEQRVGKQMKALGYTR